MARLNPQHIEPDAKADGKTILCNWVASSVSSNHQIVLEVEPAKLTAGDYVIMVEAIWNKSAQTNKDYKSYSIVLHHANKIDFKRTDVVHPSI